MKHYDVIVAGNGPGGLAAGYSLAKNGKKVLIIENTDRTCGFAGSVRRGRFDFDICPQFIGDFNRGRYSENSVKQMDELFSHCEFVSPADSFRLINHGAEITDITVPRGADNFIKFIDGCAPSSGEAAEYIWKTAREGLSSAEKLRKAGDKKDIIKILSSARDFLFTSSKTVNEILDMLYMSDRAKEIMKSFRHFSGVSCDSISFAQFFMMFYVFIETGIKVPVKKSAGLISQMENIITELGSDIIKNSKITGIKKASDNNYSVKISDEDEFSCDYLIYDGDPHILYRDFIKEESLNISDNRKYSPCLFSVHLGLDKSCEELGIKNYITVISHNDSNEFEKMSRPGTDISMFALCPDVLYQSSPEGTSVLSLHTFFTSDWWEKLSKDEYYKFRDAYARILVKTFEKETDISLCGNIGEAEILTPAAYEALSLSPHGSLYGYAKGLKDGYVGDIINNRAYGNENLFITGIYGSFSCNLTDIINSGFDTADKIINGGKNK